MVADRDACQVPNDRVGPVRGPELSVPRSGIAGQGRPRLAVINSLMKRIQRRGKYARLARTRTSDELRVGRPEDRGTCPHCGTHTDKHTLAANLFVCPGCGHHFRIDAMERVRTLLDGGEMNEYFAGITTGNPIEFPEYTDKLEKARAKCGHDEAITTGVGRIEGREAVVCIMSFQFLGGSMGTVVGERLSQALLLAVDRKLPCVVFSASGGARMQEGVFSLVQMAKTTHAVALAHEAAVPVFVVLTDPTTGGVTASFAMVGDVTLAEPEALVGFAGPRVIEGTIRQKLPHGFQRSEFQLEKGFVDAVVPRSDLRSTLAYLIDTHPAGSA